MRYIVCVLGYFGVFLIFGKFEKKWILIYFFKFYLLFKIIFRELLYRIWLEKKWRLIIIINMYL